MGIVTKDYDRKNIKKTIEVFQKSMSDMSDVALLLKVSGVHISTSDLMSTKKWYQVLILNLKTQTSIYFIR